MYRDIVIVSDGFREVPGVEMAKFCVVSLHMGISYVYVIEIVF